MSELVDACLWMLGLVNWSIKVFYPDFCTTVAQMFTYYSKSSNQDTVVYLRYTRQCGDKMAKSQWQKLFFDKNIFILDTNAESTKNRLSKQGRLFLYRVRHNLPILSNMEVC